MKERDFQVIKASGQKVRYDHRKIIGSLKRAGASADEAEAILAEAEKDFHSGITTKKILSMVMKQLEKEQLKTACLYDLKGGIRRLGPAGYNFETYVGEIFREYGYSVRLRQMVSGRCTNHEIDLIVQPPDRAWESYSLVECKYHKSPGTFVDLKEMMYTWARYLDINESEEGRTYEQIIMVSNTRTSQEASRFALCRDVKILSWRHPPGHGLEKLIRAKSLYPVTILRSASTLSADLFSRAGLMLVKDFPGQDPRDLLSELKLPINTIESLIQEAEMIVERTEGGDNGLFPCL